MSAASAASADPFASVAWTIATIVALLIALLLAQILVLRLVLALRHRRVARLRDRWEPLLATSIDSPAGLLPRLRPRDVPEFLLLWNYIQESLRDVAGDRLNDVARCLGIGDAAADLLRRGGVRERLIAMTALGHLRDDRVWQELVEQASAGDTVPSLCAAKALVRIDAARAAPFVVEQFAGRTDWPVVTVAAILAEAGPDVVSEPLARSAASAQAEHAARLIRLFDMAHSEAVAPVIRQALETSDDTEVLTGCLRVAREPQLLDRIRELMRDQRWQVRLRAVQALGRLGGREDEPLLVDALSDPQWWVRYRAAQALVAMPLLGTEHIHSLSETVRDRYGRDILRQAIAERELASC